MENFTNFFESDIECLANTGNCFVYRTKNDTGEGVITQYYIMPGIYFFYNDIRMTDGKNKNKLPIPEMLEINHCREGRFECEFENGNCQFIGAGDLSVHLLPQKTVRTFFPMGRYHGISIGIDLNEAEKTIARLESITGKLDIDLRKIADNLSRTDTCFILRDKSVINHIFSELYNATPGMIAHYLKVKVLELLMYLNDINTGELTEEKRYFYKNQVDVVKSIHDFMIEHIDKHFTLQKLSDMFGIPLTSMKVCFKGVYGSSIYSYMRSYRMQAATILLKGNSSITEIAMKTGYTNPSKFSENFKREFGMLPTEFRKQMSK